LTINSVQAVIEQLGKISVHSDNGTACFFR
jgi:hypothetical protein